LGEMSLEVWEEYTRDLSVIQRGQITMRLLSDVSTDLHPNIQRRGKMMESALKSGLEVKAEIRNEKVKMEVEEEAGSAADMYKQYAQDALSHGRAHDVDHQAPEKAASGKKSSLSSLRPKPDRDKAMKIVQTLDTSGDGVLSAAEVKVLFSKILCVDVGNIPDDHPEVKEWANMRLDEMATKLCETMTKAQVNEYHAALGLAGADVKEEEADAKEEEEVARK